MKRHRTTCITALLLVLCTCLTGYAEETDVLLGGRIGYTQIVGLNRTAILCNIKDASGGNENISYTWEKKSGSGTWQTISASGKEYSATINAETSFRRKATDGTQTAYSNTVTAYICTAEDDPIDLTSYTQDSIAVEISQFTKFYDPTWDEYYTTLKSYTSVPSGAVTFRRQMNEWGENWFLLTLSQDVMDFSLTLHGTMADWDSSERPWSKKLSVRHMHDDGTTVSDIYIYDEDTGGENYDRSTVIEGNSGKVWTNGDDWLYPYNTAENATVWWEYRESTETGWEDNPGELSYGDWNIVTGADRASFDIGPVYKGMQLRRGVSDGLRKIYSNTLTVDVEVLPFDGGLISGSQTVVAGEQAEEIGNVQEASGGVSGDIDIEYRWEYSTDSVSWIPVSGSSGISYQPPALTRTTYYRRHAKKMYNHAHSNVSTVRVLFDPGNIYIDRKQMSGMINIRSSSPAAGGNGIYRYQWMKYDEDAGKWGNIAGATSETYSVTPTVTSCYVRRAISGKDTCYSNIVTSFVENENFIVRNIHNDNSLTRQITHYDGLGRPIQHTDVGGGSLYPDTNAGKDIIRPVLYDPAGRDDAISYLPYVAKSAGGLRENPVAEQADYYSKEFDGDTYAFTEKFYEDSPLNRTDSTYNTGREYREADKLTRFAYMTNSENEVPLIRQDESGHYTVDGCYRAGTLTKTMTMDEDEVTTIEYKDLSGLTVMRRTVLDDEYADTYYVYDGNKRTELVLTPMAMTLVPADGAIDSSCIVLHCYKYSYDKRGNVTGIQYPGGASKTMQYDTSDRLVLSCDHEHAEASENSPYLCRKYFYDSLDRLTEVRLGMLGEDGGYTDLRTLAEYRYDSYAGIPAALAYKLPQDSSIPYDDRVKGLKTYEKIYESSSDTGREDFDFEERAFYYDGKGRLIQTASRRSDGIVNRLSSKYDFAGNIISTTETAGTDSKISGFAYDQRNRLVSASVSVNGSAPALTEYSYNALGQLTGMSFGDTEETIGYNIQGWLTSSDVVSPAGTRLFSSALEYFAPEHTTPSYTGNIAEWNWENGNGEHAYSFSYDKCSRLTSSTHHTGGTQSSSFTENGISHDLNGNILTLSRTGKGGEPENLTFSYTGNRLTVMSAMKNSTTEDYDYEYDARGNINKDSRNGLRFRYNPENLLESAVSSDGRDVAKYGHLYDGTKLYVKDGSGAGLEYKGSFIYASGNGTHSLESVLFDGGRFVPSGQEAMTATYNVSDHIGSVRIVVDNDGNVLERNNFYPSGVRWDDDSPADSANRYRFNGKEEQFAFGVPYIDYGARMYDPVTVRWTGMDPLAEEYYSVSPYTFCSGNPVRYVDVFGDSLWVANNAVIEALYHGLEDKDNVSFEFNNGVLNPASIPKNSSDFFINDILEIASSKQMVELTIATEYNYKDENGNIGTIYFKDAPIEFDDTEDYLCYMDSNGNYPQDKQPLGYHIQGNLGRTLVPAPSPWMSTNGNIQIIINGKGALNHRTVGIVHEFGHAILYLRGKPHKHGEIYGLEKESNVNYFINKKAREMSIRLGYDN